MAALDAVAKLNANAAPRAIVRIIDCFLVLEVKAAPNSPVRKIGAREPSIGCSKDNDDVIACSRSSC
jgi:hypothetical protein